jgi:dTDP-4-dehydrorhamnose 3,5-epimerase
MAFSFVHLEIAGVVLIRADKFSDERGCFMETYSRAPFVNAGIEAEFIQDNQSLSVRPGTLRGLHFQRAPVAQAKLVRVIQGSVFDVAADIRPESPTYGRWCGARLTANGCEQLFVPRGFAHGFVTLEENTVVSYKVDAPYSREAEGGVRWNDPTLGVAWPMPAGGPILAERDSQLPFLGG